MFCRLLLTVALTSGCSGQSRVEVGPARATNDSRMFVAVGIAPRLPSPMVRDGGRAPIVPDFLDAAKVRELLDRPVPVPEAVDADATALSVFEKIAGMPILWAGIGTDSEAEGALELKKLTYRELFEWEWDMCRGFDKNVPPPATLGALLGACFDFGQFRGGMVSELLGNHPTYLCSTYVIITGDAIQFIPFVINEIEGTK